MRRLLRLTPLLLPLASCTAPSPPPKPTAPAPVPPPIVAAPAPEQRRDRPETPGDWTYVQDATGSAASYGRPGSSLFQLRCDRASRRISLTRSGASAGALRVETSYSAASWPALSSPGGATVILDARDAFLDKMAFSRGRFTVKMDGTSDIVLPAWAEPSRVIEDCRS